MSKREFDSTKQKLIVKTNGFIVLTLIFLMLALLAPHAVFTIALLICSFAVGMNIGTLATNDELKPHIQFAGDEKDASA